MLWVRRTLMAIVTTVTVAGAVLAWPSAAAAAADDPVLVDVDVTRYAGADRYETSLLVAEAVAEDAGGSLDAVVLVSGRNWADAVVAAPVAGDLDAPVLMIPPGELLDDTVAFLQRTGASRVVLVGTMGDADPFTAAVISPLLEMGLAVERVGGVDRYATGALAARRVDLAGVMPGFGRTAIVASGEVFADALVAGPFAARGSHPVMLTPPGELHAEVEENLRLLGIEHVVLMGGTAAVSDAVEQSIENLGLEVTRLAGATRYDTAVKAAELVAGRYSDAAGDMCFTNERIGLARARVPFDSFSAGPLLGRLCAPLLLADPAAVPPDTAAFLDASRAAGATAGATALELSVFGGDAAVSQAALDAYLSGEGAGVAKTEAGDSDTPGVLPAGTCGGSIEDEPRPLLDSDRAEDPSWSPDCRQIVYSDRGSLWIMDNDGTNLGRVTAYDGAFSHDPSWSPDGTRIVYTRGRHNDDGNWFSHIYVVNVDGTGRTKLSSGDVEDSRASYSPDGNRIVFERLAGSGRTPDGGLADRDRYIATMDATGGDRTALTNGGRWDHLPSWSPDGSRIAYVSNDAVWLIDADGSNARSVLEGAFWRGGTSWSPDGTRIAFGRGDLAQSSLIVADLDGVDEVVVVDLPGRNWMPRWSPDGQRIAFSRAVPHDDESGQTAFTFHAYTVGAHGEAAALATDCRPTGIDDTTAGFPLPAWAASPVGTLRVAMLFMDFPDAQAAHTTEVESEFGLPYIEAYVETASYGHLDVEFVPHHQWLRASQPYVHYTGPTGPRSGLTRTAGEHAVELADPNVDFSDMDAVMTVFPSTHFGGGNAGGVVTADGSTMPHSRINDEPWSKPADIAQSRDWGDVAAHELVHNLGLTDLYPYDLSAHDRPPAPEGSEWVLVELGLMELNAWYVADASHMVTRLSKHYADGSARRVTLGALRPMEMLAWSRWQLGWLGPDRVRCISEADATVTLAPVARPGEEVVMAAVPLNAREVIVVESRRQLGYDLGEPYVWPEGDSDNRPALITEGVLVYTVDALVSSGRLPIAVAGDSGDGQVDSFPVLRRGESVTLRGYTITVIGDNDDTHTVTITLNL